MYNQLKRFTALVLVLIMVVTMMPTSVLANGSSANSNPLADGHVLTGKEHWLEFEVNDGAGDKYNLAGQWSALHKTYKSAGDPVNIGYLIDELKSFYMKAFGASANRLYQLDGNNAYSFSVNGQNIGTAGSFTMPDQDTKVTINLTRISYQVFYGWNSSDIQNAAGASVTFHGETRNNWPNDYSISYYPGDIVHVQENPYSPDHPEFVWGDTSHTHKAWRLHRVEPVYAVSAGYTFDPNVEYYKPYNQSTKDSGLYLTGSGGYPAYFVMPAERVDFQGHFAKGGAKKSHPAGVYKLGQQVEFTITAYNTDQNPQDVRVEELEGVEIISSNPQRVAGNSSVEFKAVYTITENDIINEGFLNSANVYIGGTKHIVEDFVEVEPPTASMYAEKTSSYSDEKLELGSWVNYTVTVTNNGTLKVNNVSVYDKTLNRTLTPEKTTLEPGESTTATTTYQITQADVDAGKVANVAIATGKSSKGDDVTSNEAKVEDPVSNNTLISIKSADHSWMYDGNTYKDNTYTVTYGGTQVTVKKSSDNTYTATLPTGDILTITSTAAGVTNVSDTKEKNNTFTWAISNSSRYTNVQPTYGTLAITPADVTVMIVGKSATVRYNGEEQSVKGYEKFESSNALYGTANVTLKSGYEAKASGTLKGEYPMGLSQESYNVNDQKGNFKVSLKVQDGLLKILADDGEIVIKANNAEKVYDGSPLTEDTVTVTGTLHNGDHVVAVTEGSQTDAGNSENEVVSYQIVNASGNDVTESYTNIKTEKGTLTVTPAPLKVITNSGEKIYDGMPLTAAGFMTVSPVNGETVGFRTTGSQTIPGTTPNAYELIFAEDDSKYTAKKSNYSITDEIGTLTVKKAGTITITAGSDIKVYDGTPLEKNKYSHTGDLAKGDTLKVTVSGAQTDAGIGNNVISSYKIVNANDDDVTDYYTSVITYDGTLEVTKAPLTVKTESAKKDYDGTPLTAPGDLEGLQKGETVGFTVTGSLTEAGTTPNSYELIFAADDNTYTAKAGNYSVSENIGTLEIVKSGTVVIIADSDEKVYDGEALIVESFTVSGKLNSGDQVVATVSGSQTDVGTGVNEITTYKIVNKAGTDVTKNYNSVTTQPGELIVTARPVEFQVNSAEYTYDGNDKTVADANGKTYSYEQATSDNEKGVLSGEESLVSALNVVYGDDQQKSETNVGTYTANILEDVQSILGENYAVTVKSGELNIKKKDVTVTVSHSEKMYGEKDPVFADATMTGAIGNELGAVDLTVSRTVSGETVGFYDDALNIKKSADTLNATYPNYNFTVYPGDFTIKPSTKALVISSADGSWEYDGQNHTKEEYTVTYDGKNLPADATGKVFTLPNGDTVTITPTAAGVKNYKDSGDPNNTFEYVLTNSDQYENVTVDIGDLEITKKPAQITIEDSEKMYGETDPAFADALISGGIDDELSGIDTKVSRTNSDENPGTYQDVLSIASPQDELNKEYENYAITVVPGDFRILVNSKEISIVSGSETWEYDGEIHTLESYVVTYDGQNVDPDSTGLVFELPTVNHDKITVVPTAKGVRNFEDTATENNTFEYTLDNAAWFEKVSYTFGDLGINKKPVEITVEDSQKVYGEKDPAFTPATVNGGIGNELDAIDTTVIRSDKGNESVKNHEGVLTVQDTTDTLNAAYPNYEFTIVPGDFLITADQNTIVISSGSKTWEYDGKLHKLEEYSVIYGGTTLTPDASGKVFTLTGSGDKITITSTAAGVTNVSESGTENNTFTYVLENEDRHNGVQTSFGNLAVTAKDVTITVNSADKVYGDADPEFTGEVDGLIKDGDLGTVTYVRTNPDEENVSVYEDVITAEYTANNNYNVKVIPADFEITKKVVKITVADDSKEYGAKDPDFEDAQIVTTLTAEQTLELQGMDLTVIRTNDDEKAEKYSDVLTTSKTEAELEAVYTNYDFVITNGDFEITKKDTEIVITANSDEKVYDGEALENSGYTTIGTLAEGDKYDVTVEGSQTDAGSSDNTVASYRILNGNNEDVTDCYKSVTAQKGLLTVTPKAVTIEVDNSSKTYGEQDPKFTGTVTGLIDENDLGTVSYVRTNADVEDAGEYPEVLTAEYTPNKNYKITVKNGSFDILKKQVTVTVADDDKIYGENDPAFEDAKITTDDLTEEQKKELEDIDLTVVRTNADTEEAGVYTDVLTTSQTKNDLEESYPNYEFTVVPGTFTITKAGEIVITADSANKEYDGTPLTKSTYTYTGTLAAGDVLTATVEGSQTDAGTGENNVASYEITNAAGEVVTGNYTAIKTVDGKLTVTKKPVTITVSDAEKVYGNNDPAFPNAVIAGAVGTELDSIDTTVFRTNKDVNLVGEYDDVLTITDTEEELNAEYTNYVITLVPGDFRITKPEKNPVKTHEDGAYQLGDTVTFTITATNVFNEVRTIRVKEMEGVTVEGSDTIENVAPGETVTFKATYQIQEKDLQEGFTNNVEVFVGNDSWPASDHVDTAAISVDKVATNGLYTVGDEIPYTVTVKNTGSVKVSALKIADSLVPDVKLDKDELLPGESTTATYTYTVQAGDLNGITNTADVVGKDPNGKDVTGTDTEKVNKEDPEKPTDPKDPDKPVVYKAEISVDKVATNGLYTVGDEVPYTVTVKNIGNVKVTALTIADSLVKEIKLDKDELLPGESTTATYTYTVQAGDLNGITNTADVVGKDPNGKDVTGTDTEKVNKEDPEKPTDPKDPDKPVVYKAEISVDKVATNGLYTVGDEVPYTVTVKNIGNVKVTALTIADSLIKEIKLDKDELLPGESTTATYTYTVQVGDLNGITNTADVVGKDPNGKDVTGTDTEKVNKEDPSDPTDPGDPDKPVVYKAKINVTKSADKTQNLQLGDIVTYTVTVENTGDVTISMLELDDTLIRTAKLDKDVIAPKATATAKYTYRITEADILAGKVGNTATVTGKDPKGNDVGNQDHVDLTTAEIDTTLTVRKTSDKEGQKVGLGEKIVYTITVKNEGNVPYTNVKVDDDKTGLHQVIDVLAVGKTETFRTEWIVTEEEIKAGKVLNSVTAKGDPIPDPDPDKPSHTPEGGDNTEDDPDDVDTTLKIVKTSDKEGQKVGLNEKITYTIDVTNRGNVTFTNVKVDDNKTGLHETIATLAVGETKTFTTEWVVTEEEIKAGKILNSVTGKGDPIPDPDPEKPDHTPEDEDEITDVPEDIDTTLKIEKTSDKEGQKVNLNEKIKYTITVTNQGNVTFTNVKVDDDKTNLHETIPTLTVGETKTFTTEWIVTEAEILAGKILNSVTGKGDPIPDPDPEKPDHTPEDEDEITDIPEDIDTTLQVVKKSDKEGMKVGLNEKITYTIEVTNLGNVTYTNVKVDDDKTNMHETIATLAVGEKKTFTTEWTVTEEEILAGKVLNSVTGKGDPIPDPDPKKPGHTPEGKDTTEDDPEDVHGELTVTKVADKTENVKPGDTVIYKINVKNTGNVTVSDIELKDSLVKLNRIDSAIGTLEPGEEANVAYEYTVTEADLLAGVIRNIASANGKDPEGNSVSNKDEEDVTSEDIDTTLSVIKTSDVPDNETVVPGTKVTYTILVKNEGNVAFTNVKVADQLTGLNIEKGQGYTVKGSEVLISKLNVGEEIAITATYTVTDEDKIVGKVHNVAVAQGDPIPDPSDPENPDKNHVPEGSGETDVTVVPEIHNITITYVYEDGTPAKNPFVADYETGTEYHIVTPGIAGYTPDYASVDGTVGHEDIHVTVTYTKNRYDLNVHYVYDDGTTAADDVTLSLYPGEHYLLVSQEIEGYVPSMKTVEGDMPMDHLTITVIYRKPPKNTITIVDFETPRGISTGLNIGECFE